MSLILPAHLRDPGPERRRQEGPVRTLPNGAEVRQAAVYLPRHGWRHEVTASWDGRDAAGPVRHVDTLWFLDELDATQVARGAAFELRWAVPFAGLRELAARLCVPTGLDL